MSKNYISAGRRIQITGEVAHKAGDLIFYKGFFGWLQDDNAVGELGVLILEGEVSYTNPAFKIGLLAMGTKISAAPTADATTLKLYSGGWVAGSIPSGVVPIGRVSATSATATGQLILFGDNSSY
jgi:hypothetical protein